MGDNMEGLLTTYEANPSISEAVSNILHSSDLTSLSMLVSQNDSKRSKEQRVKRPMNAFMLYAQVARRKVATKYPNLNYAKLSKTLGKIWQVLPEDERRPFILEAERLRAQHKLKHPGYKYTPRRTKDKKGHGLGKKVQYENLKPEELLNILQTKRDPPIFENPAASYSVAMQRSNSLGSEDELQPLSSPVYYEDPLMCLIDSTPTTTTDTQSTTMRNPVMEEEMKAFSYREPRELSHSRFSSVPDLKWVFPGHASRPGSYPSTTSIFDTFCSNPNLFAVSQRQNSATSQTLGFYPKQDPPMGYPSPSGLNHSHPGLEYPQHTPVLKHKSVEPTTHSFFNEKPHVSDYMTM